MLRVIELIFIHLILIQFTQVFYVLVGRLGDEDTILEMVGSAGVPRIRQLLQVPQIEADIRFQHSELEESVSGFRVVHCACRGGAIGSAEGELLDEVNGMKL